MIHWCAILLHLQLDSHDMTDNFFHSIKFHDLPIYSHEIQLNSSKSDFISLESPMKSHSFPYLMARHSMAISGT